MVKDCQKGVKPVKRHAPKAAIEIKNINIYTSDK